MFKNYSICNKCGENKLFLNLETEGYECDNCKHEITKNDIANTLELAYQENEKKRAINVLIANAICSVYGLGCCDCPLYEEDRKSQDLCDGFDDRDLIEAVNTLIKSI